MWSQKLTLLTLLFCLVIIEGSQHHGKHGYHPRRNKRRGGGGGGGSRSSRSAGDTFGFPWFDRSCTKTCQRSDISTPPLLVISFDGFANEYRKRFITKALERVATCGLKTEKMYSIFPSKTFPNHYAMATGLYAEEHGIVDNFVYDPAISNSADDVRTSRDARYFKGNPIWSEAVRQGKKAVCIHWAGCDHKINGYTPTDNIPFGQHKDFFDKTNLILSYLKKPAGQRPDLIMAYFDEPDTIGHSHRSDAQVDAELAHVEKVLNHLFTELHNAGLYECVNKIIVSDHGMQNLHKRVNLDAFFDTKGLVVTKGVVGRVHVAKSGKSTSSLMQNLQCKSRNEFFAFDRTRMPVRYHFTSSDRVGDVIVEGKPGITVAEHSSRRPPMAADHGYDYLHKSMHAVFFAHGPNIRRKRNAQAFSNVELFNLFVELMQMQKNANTSGTTSFWNEYLHNIKTDSRSPATVENLSPIQQCSSQRSAISFLHLNGPNWCDDRHFHRYSTIRDPSKNPVGIVQFILKQSKVPGLNLGGIKLDSGFRNGHFAALQRLTKNYAEQFGSVAVATIAAYDADMDGKADPSPNYASPPTHIARVIIKCTNNYWKPYEYRCAHPDTTRIMAFILPNAADPNCLGDQEFLHKHSARVRDVEMITGARFWADGNIFPLELSVRWRTFVIEKLW